MCESINGLGHLAVHGTNPDCYGFKTLASQPHAAAFSKASG
jgi:hypothetical protein